MPTDVEAYSNNIKNNWVYNKIELYRKLGYVCAPHGIAPNIYPVISKPIINLWGLGIAVKRWCSEEDVSYQAGHLWMEEFSGAWESWDIEFSTGVVWHAQAQCEHVWDATPQAWHVNKTQYSLLPEKIKNQLQTLNIDADKINVETIGHNIIEVHLRWSHEIQQWYDASHFVVDVLWSKDINTEPPPGWIDLRDETANIFAHENKPVRIAHRKR